jgi:hypothetical protein
MIKLQNLTPAVYYNSSRDFQFIGRLYDLVLNYSKTNAANLYNLPIGKNMDEQLLNLLALTLGFKPTKNYNSKQLCAVCSVLPTILQHKGSIEALVLAINALLAAEGVKQPVGYTLVPKQGLTLHVAQELDDLSLFTDLLDYLLPAGLSCNIIKESQHINTIETTMTVTDTITINSIDAFDTIRESEGWFDVVDAKTLSTITPKHRLLALSVGQVGIAPSILTNTTLIQAPKTDEPIDLGSLENVPQNYVPETRGENTND